MPFAGTKVNISILAFHWFNLWLVKEKKETEQLAPSLISFLYCANSKETGEKHSFVVISVIFFKSKRTPPKQGKK